MKVFLTFLETPATSEELEIATFLRAFATALEHSELDALIPFYHPDSSKGKRLPYRILESIERLRPQTHSYALEKILIRVSSSEQAAVFFQRRTRSHTAASWQYSNDAFPLRKYHGEWRLLL